MKRSFDSLRFNPRDLPGSVSRKARKGTKLPQIQVKQEQFTTSTSGSKEEDHLRTGLKPEQLPTAIKLSTELAQTQVKVKEEPTELKSSILFNQSLASNVSRERQEGIMHTFVAPAPAKYRERFASTCESCFQASRPCKHFEESPLKLLLVGHNPSDHAWSSGFFYSNPTNRMWRLLTGQGLRKEGGDEFRGILPHGLRIEEQNTLPSKFKVGLTDVGLVPGNDAAAYKKPKMLEWSKGLFQRLHHHQLRAGKAPQIVAFTGKRQFQMLFPKTIGPVDAGLFIKPMPPGWPFSADTTKVWILPSSSGRAVMTHDQRMQPYKDLATAFHDLPDHGSSLHKATQ
mmetsp:Transcript_15849/g.29008  ORF Transcript_15849/g.29008 Transcript_15849/m.29008 type:complete len:342 (+) Transcript_15849:179-1204(+)